MGYGYLPQKEYSVVFLFHQRQTIEYPFMR